MTDIQIVEKLMRSGCDFHIKTKDNIILEHVDMAMYRLLAFKEETREIVGRYNSFDEFAKDYNDFQIETVTVTSAMARVKEYEEDEPTIVGLFIVNSMIICGCCGSVGDLYEVLSETDFEDFEILPWVNISEEILGDLA